MPTTQFDAIDRDRPVPHEVLARARRAAWLESTSRRRARVVVEHLRTIGRAGRLGASDRRCLVMAWQLTATSRPRLPKLPAPSIVG